MFGENKIQILKRTGKLGLGSAYMDGLKLVRGDFVFLMDADLSHHVCFSISFSEILIYYLSIFHF